MQNLSSNNKGEMSMNPWWQSADRSIRQDTGTSFVHPYASNGVDSSSCVLQFIIVDRIDGSLFSLARFHPRRSFPLFPLIFSFPLLASPLFSLTKFARLFSWRYEYDLVTFSPTVYLTFRVIKYWRSWRYSFRSVVHLMQALTVRYL